MCSASVKWATILRTEEKNIFEKSRGIALYEVLEITQRVPSSDPRCIQFLLNSMEIISVNVRRKK